MRLIDLCLRAYRVLFFSHVSGQSFGPVFRQPFRYLAINHPDFDHPTFDPRINVASCPNLVESLNGH